MEERAITTKIVRGCRKWRSGRKHTKFLRPTELQESNIEEYCYHFAIANQAHM
uniref:Uncharacterized protein n=1 Tax=Arundo donax TaxID=35708 RepID=A0A0A9GAY2_ARUDO